MNQLKQFYIDPSKLAAQEQAAVKNLEALMGQVLDVSFLLVPLEVAQLRHAMSGCAESTNRSGLLNRGKRAHLG